MSTIRVRLSEAVSKVQVRGQGLRVFEGGEGGQRGGARRDLAAHSEGSVLWELRCQNGRVRAISDEKGGSRRALDLREPVAIRVGEGKIEYQGRPYRDELQVRSVGSFCEVVNHVDVEKYLGGLVNSEFSSKWAGEAIGAQIVAARTYALHQMRMARADAARHYDLDATVSDQVYDGSIKEDSRSQQLVERTRGWVLTVGNGPRPAPLKAFYHSTCGGMTELPENVWGTRAAGFKRAVKCAYCGGSPALNWQIELTQREVVEAFRRAFVASEEERPSWAKGWPKEWRQAIAGRRLVDVRAGAWNAENRVSEVVTVWEVVHPRTGQVSRLELKVAGARFRDWIGPARFRSSAFQVVSRERGAWRFQGRGNGHGVGMCQWGAKTMGERGFKTTAILKHYYPDAVLRKLW
jgi:stage II sporulation protein D